MSDVTKRRLRWTLAMILLPMIVAAFAVWDLNPGHWSAGTRAAAGFVAGLLAIAAATYPGYDDD